MKIVTAAQMRDIDKECARLGTPTSLLMENAGRAVAEETRDFLGGVKKQHILCLIGAGNNGGDGLVAARYLHGWGAKVSVYLCSARPANDANLQLVKESGVTCIEAEHDKNSVKLDALLDNATGVIDALLGTGRMRPLEGIFKQTLERVNSVKINRGFKIIAVDLPSGMDADNGAIDPACPAADLTVTLAFPKPGLFCFPGADRAGLIKIADIGIAASLADNIHTELLTAGWAAGALPARPRHANKGTFGKALIIAGSINYTGAAYLACGGALRAGAGLVTLAATGTVQSVVASRLAEATYLPLPETRRGVVAVEAADIIRHEYAKYNVLLAGCGIAQDPSSAEFIASLLFKPGLPPLVLDADALNILAGIPEWWQKIPDNTILTPHPGEMARLGNLSIEKVQADRLNTARKFAALWGKTVVLKGAFTVIAAADGRCRVSPFANPVLAAAGTGDVLAGVITGLAAQGLNLYDAASLGVYLHSAAGEQLRTEIGEAGVLASDLLPALPAVMNRLKHSGGTGVQYAAGF
ncbi:MAG: NAD(P)H-hydrate dehydratase [Dehalococcoidales bacterium]|jgi:NAD(P)H-hydrate epimerase